MGLQFCKHIAGFLLLRGNSLGRGSSNSSKGQAAVEFTLIFIFLLIISWVPADFGLAFYAGQQALNASREGARLAAATRTATPSTTFNDSCTLGSTCTNEILASTSKRISTAMMRNAQITVALSGSGCSQLVTVTVNGTYNFSYYKVFRLFGGTVPDGANIVRTTSMRWEWQCA